jgi:RNA polymerase sigma-70 factor (ECF subfamily)
MEATVIKMVYPPKPAVPAPLPGDPREQLVRQHLRLVWRFLRLLGCAPEEADDLTQETFVVTLQKGTGDRNTHEVAAFLRRTARHLFLRSREKSNRREALLAAAAEGMWARVHGDDDGGRTVAALRQCTAELGERSRQVVRLFYGESRSRTEIAAILGMQETGVKTALQRIRGALRECLQRKMS